MTDMKELCAPGGIVGVGTDLAEVERVRAMLEKYSDAFLNRTFTRSEIDYCSKKALAHMHYTARFAAKEAMAKALGTGFADGVSLKDLSVEIDEKGAPHAVVCGRAKEIMESMGGSKMLVSISHTKQFASAVAVISR